VLISNEETPSRRETEKANNGRAPVPEVFNVQRDKEVGVVAQLFTSPDVPAGGIACRRMPEAVDRQNAFAHVTRNPDLQLWRSCNEVSAIAVTDLLLRTRRLVRVHD
jgi:hypothetical protein